VAAVTELPKVIELVVWAVPVAGCTVMAAVAADVGFVPLAVMLSVPPFETGMANVSETIEVLVGAMPVTVSAVAVPPNGVYVTV
jgi:hypothetical protein